MKCIDCPFANAAEGLANDRNRYCPIVGKVFGIDHECRVGLHCSYEPLSYEECPNMKYQGESYEVLS